MAFLMTDAGVFQLPNLIGVGYIVMHLKAHHFSYPRLIGSKKETTLIIRRFFAHKCRYYQNSNRDGMKKVRGLILVAPCYKKPTT